MVSFEPLQRTATEQHAVLTQGEEADREMVESVNRQDMARLRWRSGLHLGKMQLEQIANVGSVEFTLVDRPILRHQQLILVAMLEFICSVARQLSEDFENLRAWRSKFVKFVTPRFSSRACKLPL